MRKEYISDLIVQYYSGVLIEDLRSKEPINGCRQADGHAILVYYGNMRCSVVFRYIVDRLIVSSLMRAILII